MSGSTIRAAIASDPVQALTSDEFAERLPPIQLTFRPWQILRPKAACGSRKPTRHDESSSFPGPSSK